MRHRSQSARRNADDGTTECIFLDVNCKPDPLHCLPTSDDAWRAAGDHKLYSGQSANCFSQIKDDAGRYLPATLTERPTPGPPLPTERSTLFRYDCGGGAGGVFG